MPLYQSPPLFVNNVGQLISAEDLEIIRSNVALVELLSMRPVAGMNSSGNLGFYTPGYYPAGSTNFLLWAGCLEYKTGMTTLTIAGTAAGYGAGARLKVYVDGVLKDTVTPGATWSSAIALTGYTDGQIISVSINASWVSGASLGTEKFVVTAAYGSPISYAPTWPGVPTFTASFTASQLTQLCSAIAWLYGRINTTPNPANLAALYQLGPFKDPAVDAPHGQYPMYYGGVNKAFSNSILRIDAQVINRSSTDLRLKAYINGSLVYSSPSTLPIGTSNLTIPLSLSSISVGADAEVAIFGSVINAGPVASWQQGRWSIYAAQSEPDASAAYSTPATTPAPEVLMTASALATYLNNLASIVSATKARIDGAPHVFSRGRALRRFYSKDNAYNDLAPKRGRPRQVRYGERLVVRGKGVSIGYGAFSIPTDDRGQNFDNYTLTKTSSLIDGDKVQTQTIYLDQFAGLYHRTTYYLLGDVQYAAEYLA